MIGILDTHEMGIMGDKEEICRYQSYTISFRSEHPTTQHFHHQILTESAYFILHRLRSCSLITEALRRYRSESTAMTTHFDVDMKSNAPAELETEKSLDMATDLEAASSTAEVSRSYCWHTRISCIHTLMLLLTIAEEVSVQVYLHGFEILWPSLFISFGVRLTFLYFFARSTFSVSTPIGLWQTLATGYICGLPIMRHIPDVLLWTLLLSTGWFVISMAVSSKWNTK